MFMYYNNILYCYICFMHTVIIVLLGFAQFKVPSTLKPTLLCDFKERTIVNVTTTTDN